LATTYQQVVVMEFGKRHVRHNGLATRKRVQWILVLSELSVLASILHHPVCICMPS